MTALKKYKNFELLKSTESSNTELQERLKKHKKFEHFFKSLRILKNKKVKVNG